MKFVLHSFDKQGKKCVHVFWDAGSVVAALGIGLALTEREQVLTIEVKKE